MANKNLVLRLLITAKDEASSALTSLQAKAAAVAAAIGAYFTADFFGGAIRSAADFEAAMSRVAAATGATGDEFAQLKQAAEEAAAGSSFTQVETAQGLENLAKAGFNAKESIAALPGVMALAAAGDIELSQSAEIVTRTVAGLGIAVEDTGRIADVLAKGANASNTSVKGLAEALSYTAPTARSAKLSLEQVVAIIGKFADGGIDASRAGTALNAILSQFIDPASKFRTELTAIGITTSDFDKALRQLAKSGADGNKAILAVGTEAGPALRSLINQGVPALDKLKAQLDEAAGSAGETAGIMGNNLNGAVGMLSGAWDALKIKLGEPVLPVLTQGVRDLAAGLRGAIADGTVGRFGEALRSAFSSGIEWARRFAGEVDPVALAAKLQQAAEKIGAWFDDIGEKSRNAGDILTTAFGVLGGGFNTLLFGLYKLAEVSAGVWSAMLSGIALVADGFAKVTPGSLGERFKAAAEEVRIHAGAMGAVSDEFGRKAAKAFDDVVAGAEAANAGWASLTKPAEGAKAAVESVGKAAEASAAGTEKAGEAAASAAGKVESLGAAGSAAAPGVKAVGDAAKSAASDTASAADAADRLKAAYAAMGLQTAEELRKAAAAMKGHYEAIKADGTATTDILQAAFKKYAEAAIAANKGVASETIKAEAAMRGLTVVSDGTKVSFEKVGTAGAAAGAGIVAAMGDASVAVSKMRSDTEKLADRLKALKSGSQDGGFGNQSMSNNGTFEDMRRAGVTPADMQRMGYSAREIEDYVNRNDLAPPGTVNRTQATTTTDSYALGIYKGLTSDQAKVFAAQLGDEIIRANAEASGKAGAIGVSFGPKDYEALMAEAEKKAFEYAKANTNAKTVEGATQTVGGNFHQASQQTININLGGTTRKVRVSDADSARALTDLLQQLADRT